MTKDKKLSIINYDDLQSKTMDWLRFPLMMAVCFIHVHHQAFIDMQPSTVAFSVYLIITKILARIAVPLFFIISGYYFFYNKNRLECIFNKEIYISKLTKRIKTLLIPYLFWNLFFFTMFVLLKLSVGYGTTKLSSIFYAITYYDYNRPFAMQFWFIRDLIYMCIISPILFYFIKHGKIIFLLLLIFYWLLPPYETFIDKQPIIFFSIGAYFAINCRNIIKDMTKLPKYIIYVITIILIIVDLMMRLNTETTPSALLFLVHNLFILFGIITALLIVSNLIQNHKIWVNKTLSKASFFLFAVHFYPLVLIFNKLPIMFLPHNDFTFLSIYLLSVPLVSVCAVFAYKLLNKYFPKFMAIITGGR